MPHKSTIRVGIIGTGGAANFLGQKLVDEFSGRCSISGVCGSDPQRTADMAATFGNARAFGSGFELVNDPGIDAIIVASAGHTHETFVVQAITAGKPVFCEKPLATTAAACERIVEAEVAFGKRLVQVGFVRRFDPAYLNLKDTISSGIIGTPLFFHSAHRNPAVLDRFTSEMVINDMSVHDIDIARWLLEDEIATVSAISGRLNSKGRTDLVDPLFVVMTTKRGVIVDVELSANMGFGYDIRGEISGEAGVATLAETNRVVVKSTGSVHGAVPRGWRDRFDLAFSKELGEWLTAAGEGTASGPSAWDGYAATLVAETVQKAFHAQQRLAVPEKNRPEIYRAL